MKRLLFLFLFITTIILTLSADDNTAAAINLQHKSPDNHLEHFIPFDQPDVYYDSDDQTIIIDGDGAVNYYQVFNKICCLSQRFYLNLRQATT